MRVGAAWASSASVEQNGAKIASRSSPSFSWPIEIQVSVATTSAPATASLGGVEDLHAAAGPAAIARGAGDDRRGRAGSRPGAPIRTCMPARRRPAGRSGPCCWRRRRHRPAGSPASGPLPLPDGLQVGQDLTGVVGVGERVDHRHPGVVRHLLQLAAGRTSARRSRRPAGRAPGRCRRSARRRRAGQPGVHDHRIAAELGDAGREGDLGPQRGLVEEHRDAAGTGERGDQERVGLERVGQVEDLGLLLRAQVVVGQEVAQASCRHRSTGRSSSSGSAATKVSSWAAVTISGGASRSTSGRGALMMNPASSAASDDRGGDRRGQGDAAQQATTPYAGDPPVVRAASPARPGGRPWPSALRQQAVPLDHRDDGQPGDRCHRVAAEGAAVAAGAEQAARLDRWPGRPRSGSRCRAPWRR